VTIATGTKNTQPEVNGEPVVLYVTVANTNANTQYHVVSFYDDKKSIMTTSDLSGLNSEVNVPEGAEYFSVEYPLQNDKVEETAITQIPEVSSNVSVSANGAITITPRT